MSWKNNENIRASSGRDRVGRLEDRARVLPVVVDVLGRDRVAAPTSAAMGRVMNQATAIRPATRQRTWAPGLPRPDPRIEPVATWVVERANPSWLDARMTAAAEPWAAVPWRGSISVMPLPMVRMIRQPPT